MTRPRLPTRGITALFGWLCAITCIAGFGLRLARLDAQSIWWDEAISLHLAISPVSEILADRAAHVNPPLYFLLLKPWLAIAGESAFSARFLSVWFGVLLIPAAYAFGRRFLSRAAGLAASLLTAGSAAYIVYSQEARVYAILPLVYLVSLALVERVTEPPRDSGSPSGWGHWLILAGIQAAGLHLHYTFVLSVAYVYALLFLRLRHSRRAVIRWMLSLTLVAVLCLPWAFTVFGQRAEVRTDAGVDDPFVEPLPLGFFLHLLWTFQWTGLTGATGSEVLRALSLLIAVLLAAGLALLSTVGRPHRKPIWMVAGWLGPVLPATLLWQAKPLSHPRYVLTFSIALFLAASALLAEVAARSLRRRIVAIALGLGIAAVNVLALIGWYCAPQYAKDDTRGLATWLEEQGGDGLIIAPYGDWTLDFAGPAEESVRGRIVRPNPADETTFWETLSRNTGGARQAFLVSYPRDQQDRRGLLPFALESAGSLVDRHTFRGILVRTYDLARPVAGPPALGQRDARFGPVTLKSAWIEQDPPAGTAVALSLRWALDQPAVERYRISLRLREPDGWIWSTADDWILDSRGNPTDAWGAGAESVTYHVLPLPPGLPPLTYTISAGVYYVEGDGTVAPIDLLDTEGNPSGHYHEVGIVLLQPAAGIQGDPYGVSPDLTSVGEPGMFEHALALEAASLDRHALTSGQSVYVTLRWRGADSPLRDVRPLLILEQAGVVLAEAGEAPASGRYPTNRWRPGEIVLERRRLTVPAGARPGSAQVVVGWDGHRVLLDEVVIGPSSAVFEQPAMDYEVGIRFGEVADLLGYDLAPGPYVSGQPVAITLYWRALPGAVDDDLSVFAHLLAADGHLVAQHDGPPAAGARPTRGWLRGEVIADTHAMAFRQPYSGPATIVVGLYSAATVTRVFTSEGETAALLPTVLDIVEP